MNLLINSYLNSEVSAPLHLYGNGPLYHQITKEHKNNPNIFVHGYVSNPWQFLTTQDILILPSIVSEACPMVLLEASVHSVNFITTNLGGQLEIASLVGGNIIVKPNVLSLSRAIKSVCSTNTDFKIFSERNLIEVQKFLYDNKFRDKRVAYLRS